MTHLAKWTSDEDQYMRVHYPHVETKQLARILKRERGAVVAHAAVLGITKAHLKSEAVLRLSARPDGMRAADLGLGEGGRRICSDMARKEKIYRVTISFKNVRYFLTQAMAAEWQAKNTRPATVTVKHDRTRAWWDKDAPMYNPNNVQPQVCPSPRLDGLHTNWGCGIGGLL